MTYEISQKFSNIIKKKSSNGKINFEILILDLRNKMGPKKMTGGYLIDTQVMVEGAQDKVGKLK